MAPTNASGMKNRSPQTRLAVAFPLVWAGAPGSAERWRSRLVIQGQLLFPKPGRIGHPPQRCRRMPRKVKPFTPRAEIARNTTPCFAPRQCGAGWSGFAEAGAF